MWILGAELLYKSLFLQVCLFSKYLTIHTFFYIQGNISYKYDILFGLLLGVNVLYFVYWSISWFNFFDWIFKLTNRLFLVIQMRGNRLSLEFTAICQCGNGSPSVNGIFPRQNDKRSVQSPSFLKKIIYRLTLIYRLTVLQN